MMAADAQDAVDHAKSACGVTLDYSPDSIRSVETVLENLYAAMPRGFLGRLFGKRPSDEDIWTICKMYGGYIGKMKKPLPGVQLQSTGEAGGGTPGNDHGGLAWS